MENQSNGKRNKKIRNHDHQGLERNVSDSTFIA